MDIKNLLFSFNGRIRRLHFWIGAIGVAVVFGILYSVANMLLGPKVDMSTGAVSMNPMMGIVSLVIYIAELYLLLAIYWKRMHDTNRSGWWSLLPIFNIIVAGFFPGTTGENKFGPDPKAGTAAPAAA
jgi:uncharacterized membrane protein YhaH (DUF805 family)